MLVIEIPASVCTNYLGILMTNVNLEERRPSPIDIFENSNVWTPEIDRLAGALRKWLRMDIPGAAVYGAQRNGKSRACAYLVNGFSEIVGYALAAVKWTIPEQIESKISEREFVQEMMKQSDCDRITSRDLAVLRNRCYSHLRDLALTNGSRRIVIIVDEAQKLVRSQYGYLIHCHNTLEKMGIQPFFVLVGQPELKNSPSSWKEASGLQVLGRFFSRQYLYRGIAEREISQVLDSFDTPYSDDGQSPVAALFPLDYANGWKLKDLDKCYAEALQMLKRQHNISVEIFVPMQYFRSSLLALLYEVADRNMSARLISSAMVLEAIRETDFSNVLAYYAMQAATGGKK